MMSELANFVSGTGRRTMSVLQAYGRASLMLFGAIVTRPKPLKNLPLLVKQL
ncbi:ABC transporter permease, partial [Vibrio xuii]